MKVFRVNFKDGVYLHGQVAQAIGLAEGPDGEVAPMNLMGLKRVSSITPNAAGLIIVQGGRHFFVPWDSISSCEIEPTLPEKATVDLLKRGKAGVQDLL
jgi:hypothetical protein